MKKEGKKITFEYQEDLPPTAMSLSGTDWNKTGSWKYLEPHYQNQTPPCSNRCLTGNDVVGMMKHVEEGRWEDAVRGTIRTNPFPSITGRVCPHPCEQPCNRKAYGGGISVRAVERRVGDFKLRNNVMLDLPEAKHGMVHVIGSGPAGLSSAIFLRMLGHPVTVHEKEKEPGGLLRYGIPAYRLPTWVVQAEVEWLEKHGVKFDLSHKVDGREVRGLGPTILGFGFSATRDLRIEGEDLPGVHSGIDILRAVRYGEKVDLGERVAVIGGGNTAVDVAQTLLRLGKKPTIYYRRSVREMPAFKEEVELAQQEGIEIEMLTTPVRVEKGKGKSLNLVMIRMELGEPDDSGRRRPIPKEGTEYTVEVDAVVKALGEVLEEDLVPEGVETHWGKVVTTDDWKTRDDRIYAAGDCVSRLGNTVSEAIQSGRLAAYALHQALTGEEIPAPNPLKEAGVAPEIAKFKDLNMSYFEKEAPETPTVVAPDARKGSFDPIEGDLSDQAAEKEAARCFKCGTCTECDTCLYFCPDLAIHRKEDGGYEVDMDYCKGCMVCVQECPRNAIHLRRSS